MTERADYLDRPAPARGRSRFWATATTIAWRNLVNLTRNPAALFPPLVMPLFFFIAFAGGLSAVGSTPGFGYPDYETFQFVFVLIQAAAFGGVFTGFAIAADFEFGFARRLLLAAQDRRALIAGYALVALVRAGMAFAVLIVAALIAGAQIDGGGLDLFGLFGLALLVNFAALLFASGIAFRLRSLQGGPAMQVPVFIALLTAPVYVPVELIEGWVHGVAQVNPITPLLEAGRGLAIGDPVNVGLAFAVVAGLIAALAVWSVRGLRRAEAAG
ncbi:MAG: ABC transporter permease [Solirubrobacterales bacterium]